MHTRQTRLAQNFHYVLSHSHAPLPGKIYQQPIYMLLLLRQLYH
jgi:hypothetical protein